MNKKGASEDTAVVAAAVTEAGDADTATDEAATIKEEDTENTTKPRIILVLLACSEP